MKPTGEHTEIERLQEENRHLRGLLAGSDKTQSLLSATECRVTQQTRELVSNREELEQQARLFDIVLSSIVDFAYTFDPQGRFTYINQALLDLWQLPLEDALGKTFLELGYPRELALRLQEQIETVFRTGQTLKGETPYTGAAGTAGYYEYIFVPVIGTEGTVQVVAGSTRDITARHQDNAERETLLKALEVERERLTHLFLQAPAFITVVRGAEHTFEMANPPYYQLVGHRDILGKSVREALPEVEGQGFFELLDEVYRTGQPFIGKEMRLCIEEEAGAPLQERYVDFVYQPLIEADGSVSGIFAHGIDLTEHKRAEEALREKEERYRLALDTGRIGAWDWDIVRQHVTWSDRVYEFYGMEPGTFSGKLEEFAERVYPEDLERVSAAIQAALDGRVPYDIEYRIVCPNGEVRWIATKGQVFWNEDGEPLRMIGATTDITQRMQTQLEIEALNARLHRSMTETHHRVKNNLQIISALVEMQMEESSDTVPVSALARIGQHTRSIAAIHDLLTQESKTHVEMDTISTRSALNKLLSLLQATAGERHIRTEIDEFALPIQESVSLVMLVSELVSNALKHGGGEIEITLRHQGSQAELQVCDDGPGFPVDFNPHTSGNTGLGLIDSTGRYDLHGTILYENRAEGGARIRVVFPFHENTSRKGA